MTDWTVGPSIIKRKRIKSKYQSLSLSARSNIIISPVLEGGVIGGVRVRDGDTNASSSHTALHHKYLHTYRAKPVNAN